MTWIENSSNHEFIDNESVNVDKKLDKIEHQQAINFLNEVDSKIPYDIDLTYDKINKKYYFIWNEKFKLNIWLNLNDLNLIWNILIESFKIIFNYFEVNLIDQ